MSVNCLWGLLRLTTFVLWLCFHRGEGTRAVNLVEVLFICISFCTIWGNAECRSIAAAQAPLQFARNYLSYVIYIRIPLCKGRCTCSLCLSFLLDLFVFSVNAASAFITGISPIWEHSYSVAVLQTHRTQLDFCCNLNEGWGCGAAGGRRCGVNEGG